tara:strand:- start:3204 stop:3746 length:543 start_codon:yes stop_codon:yes gene_type:complete
MKICILKEKRVNEKRVPLIPSDIKKVLDSYPLWKFYIEPSKYRIISDHEFYKVGCRKYKSQRIDLFLSIKEVSANKIISNNNYLFFSHIIKGQNQNLSLLKIFFKKNASLLDYELFKNNKLEDNLSSGMNYESSKYFSSHLKMMLPKILKSLDKDSIEEYFITKKGYLNYRYLNLLNKLI